jgi:hypothetical protein
MKMKITLLFRTILFLSILLIVFSNGCLAEILLFEANDEIGDVSNEDVDIVYANITEHEDNYVFYMQVSGKFNSSDLKEYRYIFKINEIDKVWFSNNLAYLYDPFFECDYTLDSDKLTIYVPKTELVGLKTPWEVIATATIYQDSIQDQLDLENIYDSIDNSTDDSDNDNIRNNDSENNTPGFEFILLILILVAIVIFKRKKY